MKDILKGFLTLLVFFAAVPVTSAATPELTNKERNILAKEAKAVDLQKVLITDNSWNKLPVYKERQFWEALPANIRKEYIESAEGYFTIAGLW